MDEAQVRAWLQQLAPKVQIAPIEPYVVFDESGKPAGLRSGRDGVVIDLETTTAAVQAYMRRAAAGGDTSTGVAIAMNLVSPQLRSVDDLSDMVLVGGWTTVFFPGETNGFGVNIRLPASLLNGQVVSPGQQFSFLNAVSPIDAAHGWALGGVILGGKSDHTGAIGGGICSVSTTMFNAAARAGLQIDERSAHSYYIDRYPVGLDATVFEDGSDITDLKWTNDTPNPILIRGYTTGSSSAKLTIELWSKPINRTVTFTPEFKANIVYAGDSTVYVTSRPPGVQYRTEYPTNGFDTTRIRTVTDAAGNVIHTDEWNSHYAKVDGVLEIGVSPPPAATPTPAPTPKP